MRAYGKRDAPPEEVRRLLEPGPVVLISSAHRGERNVMTCGWHLILGLEPALVGCFIWDRNHSHAMIRRSRECVINVPTTDLVEAVIGIGNCHGPGVDKFAKYELTPAAGTVVAAPLIAECHSCFECRLVDASLIRRHGLFVFEVVAAHVARSPRQPETLHYRGEGVFMLSGRNVSYRRRFKPENL